MAGPPASRPTRAKCAGPALIACALLALAAIWRHGAAWAARSLAAAPACRPDRVLAARSPAALRRAAAAARPAGAEGAKAGADSSDGAAADVAGGGGTVWVNRPNQRSFEVRWNSGDTIADLKAVVEAATGVPPKMQELRSNGVELHPDSQSLEEWALASGGVAATAGGKAPDIWLFDGRSDEERAAVDPPAGSYEEDEGLDVFRIAFYVLFVFPLTLYVVTQALGVNPFEQQTPLEELEYEFEFE